MNKPYIHGMLPDTSAPEATTQAPAGQIRFIGDMQRVQPQPGDVLVLTCEQCISLEMVDRIRGMVREVFGDVRVMVLGDGMKLGLVGNVATDPQFVSSFTVGDGASMQQVAAAVKRCRKHEQDGPELFVPCVTLRTPPKTPPEPEPV